MSGENTDIKQMGLCSGCPVSLSDDTVKATVEILTEGISKKYQVQSATFGDGKAKKKG